ncbi:MAG TPA: alpha/beta hydrolase-fold protein [Bacteroidota bacterium]|nr:alpha/beta hydrolase-fold protein [Bacteroidota bacterium]
MQHIQTSLHHRTRDAKIKTGQKHPTLVLLHGRGADENDLLSLADYLDERLFLVSVRAPFQFPAGGGYTWYDLLEVEKPEPKMFDESYQKLIRFMDDICREYPVDPARLFLCGFSMGTIMSYALALTKPGTFAGVIANSGYVPEQAGLTFDWHQIRRKPFFVSHGLYDPVIPVSFGRRAKDLLQKAEADLSYREYESGHQFGEDVLNDIMRWLPRYIGG